MLCYYIVHATTKFGPIHLPVFYDIESGEGTLRAALHRECECRNIIVSEEYDVEWIDSATYHEIMGEPALAGCTY